MTSVYLHGSQLSDEPQMGPDIDLLIITEDEATVDKRWVESLVSHLDGDIDARFVHPDELNVLDHWHLEHAQLLAGEALDVKPPDPRVWAQAQRQVALQNYEKGNKKGSINAAIFWAAALAVEAGAPIPNSKREAAELAFRLFAGSSVHVAPANVDDRPKVELVRGEAASAEYEKAGWSSPDDGVAMFTVYRRGTPLAFSDKLVAELLACPRGNERDINWFRHEPGHMAANDALELAIDDANRSWFHYSIAAMEQPGVHRYPVGAVFPPHCDRVPMNYDGRRCGLRALNATVLLQRAERGGELRFHFSYANYVVKGPTPAPITIDLDPGDVVVYDANIVHEVSEITAGERVSFVAPALRAIS